MKQFVYKPYTKEEIDSKLTSSSTREGLVKEGVVVFTPKIGASNRVRILPQTWTEERDLWCKEVWIHYDVGPDNSALLCLKRNFGKDCPVCEAYASETDPTLKNKFLPKKRMVAYIIDRSDESPTPKVWFMPPTLTNQILLQTRDEDSGEVIYIDHPYEGYDVTIMTQKGPEGVRVKYTYEGTAIARKPSPIHPNPKVVEQILDYIVEHPIPSIFNVRDYDYMKKVLYGIAVKPLADVKVDEHEEIIEEEIPKEDNDLLERLPDLKKKWGK